MIMITTAAEIPKLTKQPSLQPQEVVVVPFKFFIKDNLKIAIYSLPLLRAQGIINTNDMIDR